MPGHRLNRKHNAQLLRQGAGVKEGELPAWCAGIAERSRSAGRLRCGAIGERRLLVALGQVDAAAGRPPSGDCSRFQQS